MPLTPPPTQQAISDKDGNISLQWGIFFNNVFTGDAGEDWLATFTNLLTGTAPKVIGRVYRLSQYLAVFTVRIEPGDTLTAKAGTTYIDNFPLTMTGDGFVIAVSGGFGALPGMCDSASNRIYIPDLSNVSIPVTFIGLVEIQGVQ